MTVHQPSPGHAALDLYPAARRAALLLGTVLAAASAHATGLLLPRDRELPPLAITRRQVEVKIDHNLAHTTVKQTFANHTGRALEAVFVFPMPAEAKLDEFVMMMNGKRVKGEVLARAKARRIYNDIVRRMRDPGLIEYMDHHLFRASIYPVPARGQQEIEISYAQVLKPDAGLAEYVLPLTAGKQEMLGTSPLSVLVTLASKPPLKSIYSPTHRVDVVRKSDHLAKVSFELRGPSDSPDFRLL